MESVSSLTNAIKDEDHPQPGEGAPRHARLRASGTEAGQSRGSRIDHRQGNRHRTMMLVKVHEDKDRCAAGLLYDVSADGMFVLSEMPPGVNKCVDIEFALSPSWDMAISIKGIVVHRRSTGFGLMFREPDDPALDLLEDWLRTRG